MANLCGDFIYNYFLLFLTYQNEQERKKFHIKERNNSYINVCYRFCIHIWVRSILFFPGGLNPNQGHASDYVK